MMQLEADHLDADIYFMFSLTTATVINLQFDKYILLLLVVRALEAHLLSSGRRDRLSQLSGNLTISKLGLITPESPHKITVEELTEDPATVLGKGYVYLFRLNF